MRPNIDPFVGASQTRADQAETATAIGACRALASAAMVGGNSAGATVKGKRMSRSIIKQIKSIMWHQNNPDWFYNNHQDWVSLNPRWRDRDGDYDQQHVWHYGQWWYNQDPNWVKTRHPDWLRQHQNWTNQATQQRNQQQDQQRQAVREQQQRNLQQQPAAHQQDQRNQQQDQQRKAVREQKQKPQQATTPSRASAAVTGSATEQAARERQ